MDFIEQIFGISPDNGSGFFEISIVVAAAALIWIRMLRRKRTKWRNQ